MFDMISTLGSFRGNQLSSTHFEDPERNKPMAESTSPPLKNVENHGSDDFKRIHGIGAGIESLLQASGIHTYAQLAALTPDQVAERFEKNIGMWRRRVIQQDWVGQARQLAAESIEPETDLEVPNSHQHYASFNVELLLDENNNVRRTRVLNVQSQAEDAWAGWERKRLLNFICESAALKLPIDKIEQIAEHEQESRLPRPAQATEQGSILPTADIVGEMRIRDMVLKTSGSEGAQRFTRSNQPFKAQLMLDLTNLSLSHGIPIGYSASIFARKFGSSSHRQVVGKSEGKFLFADNATVSIDDLSLPGGTYRIEAFVELIPPGRRVKPVSGLMAMIENVLLQVY